MYVFLEHMGVAAGDIKYSDVNLPKEWFSDGKNPFQAGPRGSSTLETVALFNYYL